MNLLRFLSFLVLGIVFRVNRSTNGESLTCLTVYKDGGAPAVFHSPDCPRWKPSNYRSGQWSTKSSSARCQVAMHQGHRKTQEDRTLCALDIRIPFPGPAGIKVVTVGLIGVFDGHNGARASDMASKLLLDYFSLHTYFLLDTIFSILSGKFVPKLPDGGDQGQFFQEPKWEDWDRYPINLGRLNLKLSSVREGSFHLEVLREALVRAIHDIDVAVSHDEFGDNFDSGSTATVILIADGQILVANIGDSKAFLCSEVHQPPREARATMLRLYRQMRNGGSFPFFKEFSNLKIAAASGWNSLIAKDLTDDHHPDRDDERLRVESAGGYISENGGVARVNGQLAVSRAIGDVSYKSYGVTSLPEVNDWQPLTVNDSYLVATTDGLFENMDSQDMCDILWQLDSDVFGSLEIPYPCSYSLADCIVNAAFESGSRDNLACVILPLKSLAHAEASVENVCHESGRSVLEYQDHIDELSEVLQLDPANQVVAKFDRLLVERKECSFGCFYLSENLDEDDDTFWVQRDYEQHNYDFPQALPSAVAYTFGGPLNRYNEQNMCMLLGVNDDASSDQCTNPEGFARFIGLLGSIPLHDYAADEHINVGSRYILKKRYDRGAYGEVWLAFMWNCSSSSKKFKGSCQNQRFSFSDVPPFYSETSTFDIPPDSNMFILKRIKVEKGAAVYLSGLREKYFGELFLKASTFLRGFPSAGPFDSLKSQAGKFRDVNSSKSIRWQRENYWSSENASAWKGLLGSATDGGLDHIVRFVESFESRSSEIWLVFRHEGLSLWKLLYTAEVMNDVDNERDEASKRVQILHPSKWWHWLKTTEAGREEMRTLIWQLLMSLKSCHDRNITHRDIKPENMVICIEDQTSGRCLRSHPMGNKIYKLKMRVIDFGSALDEFTMKHLYGSTGPSRAEQTSEYAPPEALLNASWHQGPKHSVVKYDVWSVGVVILELILGSPNVFQINAKTRALLDQHLEGWNESLKELAYKLRAFMEMCILVPGIPTRHQRTLGSYDKGSFAPVPWTCSEEYFSNQIKSRDPLKIGFPNIWALRLVRELLRWNPEDRLTVDDALQHPYFSQPYQAGQM